MLIVFTVHSSLFSFPSPPLFLSEPVPEAIDIQLELNCNYVSTSHFIYHSQVVSPRAVIGIKILLHSSPVP